MKWISVIDDLPELKEAGGYEKSKVVMVLVDEAELMSAELNQGYDENGVTWTQWYSHQYDDTIGNVTHWCYAPDLETK